MDREGWIDLNVKALIDWFSALMDVSPNGRLIELDGVVGGVSPDVPGRSVFNSVAYTDPEALQNSYPQLASAYAKAGCAWTVWVPEGDRPSAEMLEAAGHICDAQPRAMGTDLAGYQQPDLSGIDWSAQDDFEEMCRINDRAYGWPQGTWLRGMGAQPNGSLIYTARVDGEPAATVLTSDHPSAGNGSDCSIWCVGTLEAARGKGLATALMRQSLWDAAERGCATTTLQSTKLGRPVYERVGYEDFGAIQMWEFRPPELAGDAQPKPAA
jgi:GNAT superfamily N-acetyltransferase